MKRFALKLAAGALATAAMLPGCADAEDQRPADLEYITMTILKPSCGTVNCHSSSAQKADLVFDSVSNAKATLNNNDIVNMLPLLRREYRPMPPNDVVPDVDIELIEAWIAAGSPGL
jgi:hypothetical protein